MRARTATPIKARNPGEPYRQYLTLMLRKLDATLARIQGLISPDLAGLMPAPTS